MLEKGYDIYSKAFKEIGEIIKFFPENEYNKIPKSFIAFIEENLDNTYEYAVTHIDDFQNQKMMEETKILLALIYREYIASKEEREQIIKKEEEEIFEEEKKIREMYNSSDLFKAKVIKVETVEKPVPVAIHKESFFEKIKDIIRQFLSK